MADEDEDEWLDVPEQPTDNQETLEGEEAILTDIGGGEAVLQDDEIMVDLNLANSPGGVKGRRVPTKKEREDKMNLHKAMLLLHFAHGRARNRWCNDKLLKDELAKLVPKDLVVLFEGQPSSQLKTQSVRSLSTWWTAYFKVMLDWDPDEIDLQGKTGPAFLLERLRDRRGNLAAAVMLFVTLCRSLGILTRLIISLQPVSYRFTSEELTNNLGTNSTDPLPPPANKKPKLSDSSSDSSSAKWKTPQMWAELYLTAEARWVAVNCSGAKVDDPYSLDPPLGSPNPLRYAVGYQSDEMAMDVTRRYSSHWGARTKRLRIPDAHWWSAVLDQYALRFGSEYDKSREEWEEAELEARESMEILPKTVDEFKNHPLYALERHLKKTECIKSKEVVLGHFRGEPVFPRSTIKTLRSLPAWLKQARVLLPGEAPVKTVKARTLLKDKKEGNDLLPETPLYGFWQTCSYSSEPAKNGIVPKNRYGRVDLYQASMLPRGTVHLMNPGAKELARRFGIDYAEAVVAMDFTRGKMVPRVSGIVVCQEFEAVLVEASAEKEHIKRETLRKVAEEAALARWRKLTQGILLRDRLMCKYDKDYNKDKKQKPE